VSDEDGRGKLIDANRTPQPNRIDPVELLVGHMFPKFHRGRDRALTAGAAIYGLRMTSSFAFNNHPQQAFDQSPTKPEVLINQEPRLDFCVLEDT
jgi:hypothetical protein